LKLEEIGEKEEYGEYGEYGEKKRCEGQG